VLNNIGNLYLDNNKDKALEYLNSALNIAQNINDQSVKASIMMNIGNVYYRNKSYSQALTYYDKSNVMFCCPGRLDKPGAGAAKQGRDLLQPARVW
jgi:tetratricopeptide (TPR) repeat protein